MSEAFFPEVFDPIFADAADNTGAHVLLAHLRQLHANLAGKTSPEACAQGWKTVQELSIAKFGFGIPTVRSCAAIAARFPRIFHMNAGTGYWTKVLRAAGAEVHATVFERPDFVHSEVKTVESLVDELDSCAEWLDSDTTCLFADWLAPFWWSALPKAQAKYLVLVAPEFLLRHIPGLYGDNSAYRRVEWPEMPVLPEWPGLECQVSLWRRWTGDESDQQADDWLPPFPMPTPPPAEEEDDTPTFRIDIQRILAANSVREGLQELMVEAGLKGAVPDDMVEQVEEIVRQIKSQ